MAGQTEQLDTFVTVVKTGSFTAAAEQLGQATSVVSRRVKQLEQRLGVALLLRTTRSLRLTSEGEWYYQQACSILRQLSQADHFLMDRSHKPAGKLRIDSATPFILHQLVPLVSEFLALYPEIELTLDSSESFIHLIEKRVDVAIRFGELTDSSLKARKLGAGFRRLLASPEYLASFGTPDTLADLAIHRCIGFSSAETLNRWPIRDKDGELYKITPHVSADSGETIRQLALHGNGIACLSGFMTQEDIRAGRLVPVLEHLREQVLMPVYAVYYSEGEANPRVRCFIDFLTQKLVL
ncbi:LysR family transcriptional regulator [Rheinheimera soli]|uniref:DNA-binding transcriptional LysR family regulator n=1 Tax=Rheinheimera soli TaxID=443616 RepID=A0ABU1W1S2_9GAMM|nr:LysR family transcriptional regulator [Rheinheimera soli]MDR7121924.1 DNA-binding transcriptional LysR family regulator [Rheinheimera soli]